MVSAQIILVSIALLGFFATGGISKVSRALETAKGDFNKIKGDINKIRDPEIPAKQDIQNETLDINFLQKPQGEFNESILRGF